jgi:hypothetical protein
VNVTPRQLNVALFAIAIALVLELGAGVYLYRRGLERGGQKEKLAALDTRSTAGRKQISIDSSTSIKVRKVAAPIKARARAARAEIRITPGSDTIYVAGELPTVSPGIVREIALSDSSHSADSAIIAADSAEKLSLRSQLSRSDSAAAVLRAMKIPRCSAKCGAAIGAGGTLVVLEIARRIVVARRR